MPAANTTTALPPYHFGPKTVPGTQKGGRSRKSNRKVRTSPPKRGQNIIVLYEKQGFPKSRK